MGMNYLEERSQMPHLKLTAIARAFGVGESTAPGKSMLTRKTLKIRPMDPEWSPRSRTELNRAEPSRTEPNPMAWMIQVNGFLVDARFLKRDIQEEALRKGLIPYILKAATVPGRRRGERRWASHRPNHLPSRADDR